MRCQGKSEESSQESVARRKIKAWGVGAVRQKSKFYQGSFDNSPFFLGIEMVPLIFQGIGLFMMVHDDLCSFISVHSI
jgi:3-hydroxymyristoyl/3-hydroxydecanoyl-(acyl carrier protein) dehydratase